MAKTMIDIDEEALSLAAEVLGTTTKKDTVNAALAEVGMRERRRRARERMRALADEGVFDKALEPGFKEEAWS
ncbi:type II toxin-antitoxin system VapB family antitoxin [Kitasatospora sp. NPDC001547]|uniref:type II toxin-antitoxin system VapB family antitoxin n=1 Tax=Kitasatospora sp. NPDC001547 TaxID=3364015 RepID=UPI0036CAE130